MKGYITVLGKIFWPQRDWTHAIKRLGCCSSRPNVSRTWCSNKLGIDLQINIIQKSSSSTPYVQRKSVFLVNGWWTRPCHGNFMDLALDALAILRFPEAIHVHRIQLVGTLGKKLCYSWLTLERIHWLLWQFLRYHASHWSYVNT